MTATAGLEHRPEMLRHLVNKLWARYEQGARLTADELEALAEACFRLAVQPATAADVALDLLAKAHHVDPVNPKHPYHVGLVHMRHGRLDAALQWLTAAAESAPANHRVWAHLSIVHQGLHEQRVGDPTYEGQERQRVNEIASAIREGRDDLVAAEDVPVSLLRPGECRWSGIHDIGAELVLRRPAGSRGRAVIAKDLQRVAELADRRRGGVAAFAVLAVQWLVHGYPPATVRRLASMLPPGDGPARRMLDLACELFEADEASLPARLATCLARQELPDLLVALVHQRRLLWRPLQVPDLGAFTAAQRFASDAEQGDPTTHLDAMVSALRTITTAVPPKTLADVAAEDTDSDVDPTQLLAAFERDVESIARLKKSAGVFAKQLRGADLTDAAQHAQAQTDHALLTNVANRLEQNRVETLGNLQTFKLTKTAVRAEEFDTRLERCEKALQQPIGLNGHLSTVRKKLRTYAGQSVTPVPPSPGVTQINAELGLLAPSTEQVVSVAPPRREPAPEDPRARVAVAIAEVEHALADNADHAWQSLDAYPVGLLRRSAIVLLRSYLNGRLAESQHRMGAHTPARRHWQAMLAENPMSTAVLHNLAVAHTAAGDVAAATRSWSRYLEALYAEALLADTAARGAAERAEIHRVLAGSFGTAALCGRPADAGPNPPPRGVPAELTSPARVALAIAHLRLEELNRALSYRSAVLRLGVARSVRRSQLDEAFDARLDLIATACAPLPERVRAPFQNLCRTAFQAAHEAACDPGGRTREATDPDEEEAHTAWTHERVRWKTRIARELLDADDWPVTESSGEILASLRLIDELRLDPADESVRRAGLRLGASTTYLRQLNDLSDLAARFAVERIFRAAENRLDSSADFPQRYQRICVSWQRNGARERYLDMLDDPQGVYLPSVERALDLLHSDAPQDEIRGAVLAALPAMEHWITRLRGAPGPAAMLGELLHVVDEHRRAHRLLTEARDAANPRDSLARVRLSIECDAFKDALACLSRLEQRGADPAEVRQLRIAIYRRWLGWDGELPTVEEITGDLDLSSHPEVADARRRLVVEVTIAKHLRRPGAVNPASLTGDLRRLLRDDEVNSYARYHLAQQLYQHAVKVRTRMRGTFRSQREALRDELTRLCTECATHTTHLLNEAANRDPADTYHAFADDTRLEEMKSIAAKVRRYQ
jgi:tetratricopeptide (TPR) repeat protein